MTKFVAIPAPFIYATTFAAGMALDALMKWHPAWRSDLRFAGWALVVVGALVGPGSAISFALGKTTLNPVGQPSRLITGAAFRLSRNPMYLGLALAYVGLALILAQVGPLLLLPLPLSFLSFVVIPFEEGRLRSKFGDEFVSYCERVRRWL